MDVTVHRHGNQLKTAVYRKPTHTGRYLGYSSHHPESAKRSVAHALVKRIEYVTTDEQTVRLEEEQIRADLEKNGYPHSFVRKTIKKKREKNNKKHEAKSDQEGRVTCTVPYVKGVSEAIGRVLAPLNIRTVSRTKNVKWTLMKGAKDPIDRNQNPGVIYALGCTECAAVYIGETARTANQRTKEHRMHTRTGHVELSAVANHSHNKGHEMHWTPRVLAREEDTTKRKIKEALAIKKLTNGRRDGVIINQDSGMKISKLWLDLV